MKIHKLTIILFLFLLFCGHTTGQAKSISLKVQNSTLKSAFEQIEKSSDYLFLIMDDAAPFLNKRVTTDLVNRPIEEVLNTLFENNNDISYSITKRQVTIFRKNNPSVTVLQNESKNNEPQKAEQPRKTIKGTVVDGKGETIIGARVVEKDNTTNGAITDANGNFTLSVAQDAMLLISFVGFDEQEFSTTDEENLNIILLEGAETLDELVVVGYGTQKKITTTGAIASIGTKQLIQSPVANISNSLVGRVPGLFAMQVGGEPGNDASRILIRGVGTFAGSTDPLVLVDGVEVVNYNNIDPNEIESVTLLKDASSTAVYGIRGANGVLIITTKRGREGPLQISYTYNQGFNSFTNIRESMSSADYARAYNTAQQAELYVSDSYRPLKYSPLDIELYENGTDPVFHPNNNWPKMMFKTVAPQSQHNISIRGGQKKVQYFISGGIFNQQGMFKDFSHLVDEFTPQSTFRRYNLRSNFDFDVTDKLKLSLNLASQTEMRSGNNSSSTERVIGYILKAAPLDAPGIVDGKIVNYEGNHNNPIQEYLFPLNRGGIQKSYRNFLNGSIRGVYDLDILTKGLSAQGNLAIRTYNDQSFINSKRVIVYTAYKLPDGSINYVPNTTDAPFGFSESDSYNRMVQADFGVNYERTFGSHTITALALYTQQKTYYSYIQYLIPKGYQGYVGRLTYDFKNRYMAEINMAYNGTENFAEGKRFGFFPAYSVGWITSNEPFFPKNTVLSFLKFRASYGEVGNDNIGNNRFLYRPTSYTRFSNRYYFGEVGLNYKGYDGFIEGATGNPYVTWERAIKKNLGVELKMFRDKLEFTGEVWSENRDNILWIPQTYSAISGLIQPPTNLGKMLNKGYEGILTYSSNINKLYYRVSANYSFARNKVLYRDEIPNIYSYQNRTGLRHGQHFVYLVDGIFNNWDEVNDASRPVHAFISNKIQPGDFKYRDINGDGIIDGYDAVPMGYSAIPEETFGLSVSLNYSNFDFSVLFQGASNVTNIYTPFQMRAGFSQDPIQGAATYLTKSWTPERYAQGLPIEFPRFSISGQNYSSTSFFLADASYVRLKNIEVGYTLQENIVKFFRIKSCRLYLNANNLLTFSKLFQGIDPEIRATRDSDNGEAYPLARTVNFGLNINF